jgi:hypothetical protein
MKSTILLPNGHLSWSQLEKWESDKEGYRAKYYRNEEQWSTQAMDYGKKFARAMETDAATDDPMLDLVRSAAIKYEVSELKLEAVLETKEGKIPLLGYLDTSHSNPTKGYREYKTGKIPWTQKRADKHGQITLYDLMVYLKYGGVPKETHLDWFETVIEGEKTVMTGRHFSFLTVRKLSDIITMTAQVKRTALEISQDYQEYLNSHF